MNYYEITSKTRLAFNRNHTAFYMAFQLLCKMVITIFHTPVQSSDYSRCREEAPLYRHALHFSTFFDQKSPFTCAVRLQVTAKAKM